MTIIMNSINEFKRCNIRYRQTSAASSAHIIHISISILIDSSMHISAPLRPPFSSVSPSTPRLTTMLL